MPPGYTRHAGCQHKTHILSRDFPDVGGERGSCNQDSIWNADVRLHAHNLAGNLYADLVVIAVSLALHDPRCLKPGGIGRKTEDVVPSVSGRRGNTDFPPKTGEKFSDHRLEQRRGQVPESFRFPDAGRDCFLCIHIKHCSQCQGRSSQRSECDLECRIGFWGQIPKLPLSLSLLRRRGWPPLLSGLGPAFARQQRPAQFRLQTLDELHRPPRPGRPRPKTQGDRLLGVLILQIRRPCTDRPYCTASSANRARYRRRSESQKNTSARRLPRWVT